MSIEQQHAILDKTYKQLTDFCGKPPRGNVAVSKLPSLYLLFLAYFHKGCC